MTGDVPFAQCLVHPQFVAFLSILRPCLELVQETDGGFIVRDREKLFHRL